MKISIITRHAPSNYGSLLQAIATQKAISKLGHQAEIADYIRNQLEEDYASDQISLKECMDPFTGSERK